MADDPQTTPDAPDPDAPAETVNDAPFADAFDDDGPNETPAPRMDRYADAEGTIPADGAKPILDFATYAEAVDQADALGLDADSVEAIGTAYRVNAPQD